MPYNPNLGPDTGGVGQVPPPAPPTPTPPSQHPRTNQAITQSGSWFYWVAGLSIINALIMLFSGGGWHFLAGLAFPELVAGIAVGLKAGAVVKAIALIFAVIGAGIFIPFGVFSCKGHVWAFIAGMVLYALDGLIFLAFGDYLSAGFHAFVLWRLSSGLQASLEMQRYRA